MKSAKAAIPRALKNEVWITYVGKAFDAKCNVSWCTTTITPFTFEAGHNIPESKGGATTIANLRPICSQCNKSMGCTFTIDEFSAKFDGGRYHVSACNTVPNTVPNTVSTQPTKSEKHEKIAWWRRMMGLPLMCGSMPSVREEAT